MLINPTGKIIYQKPDYTLESLTAIPKSADRIYTPEKSNGLIGETTVVGDPNLIPSNIKSGVNIFGVTGTYEKTVTNTYTLGMFTINRPFDEYREIAGDGLNRPKYYAFPTYSNTTIQATVGEISGAGTYSNSEGTWNIGTITRWTSSDVEVMMDKENDKDTLTASASTTLPNGTYNVQLLGEARSYGQDSAENDYDFVWRGTVTPRSTMTVSSGRATVTVDLVSDNYGWLPKNPTSYRPQYERIVFALKLV